MNASAGRSRSDRWQRALGFGLALLAEAGLVLVVLSLGWMGEPDPPRQVQLVSMSIEAVSESAQPQRRSARRARATAAPREAEAAPPQAAPAVPVSAVPVLSLPAIIPVSHGELANFDIARLPRQARPAAPGKGQMGPTDLGVPGDSKQVGSAPNGQPMYAASWYREPYPEELRGYLSLASGPGWALIACRTVADFRVDDCVGLDEYPGGSQILRAVMAAAWQFRVRPPRVGGVTRVGDWVRIRIDYTERRR